MGNIENGCHWYFPRLEKGIEEKSTTDSDEETLKNQSSIEALVRESIQNSLDVHNGSNRPVVMTFRFGSIHNPEEQITAFLDLKKHIQGSKDYISKISSDNAHYVFDPMLEYMNEHQNAFPYLCVSDHNTTGMDLPRFRAFTSKGNSFKPGGRGKGGSYGIGKAAYYMASKIRTILVSSMYKDENGEKQVVFEGFAKLTTNSVDDVMYYDKGYYDISEAVAVRDSQLVPKEFQRDDIGTSIFIMGVEDSRDEKDDLYNKIVSTVVKNFWLAIHEKKLSVIINFDGDDSHSCELTSKELERYFLDQPEFDIKGDYTNPRPYYEAVTTAVEYNKDAEIPSAVFFTYNHKVYGKAKFYIIKNDQKHDRYLKMRSPRMVVTCEKGGKRGYNGVLVCDDKWNELLTYAEPPAHDAWEKRRIKEKKNISQEDKDNAIDALNVINEWVAYCIATYFEDDMENSMEFQGIKDLLYTDKDLGSNSRYDGNSNSKEEGKRSGEEGDNGILTSKMIEMEDGTVLKFQPIASVTASKTTKATKDNQGKLIGDKIKNNNSTNNHTTRKHNKEHKSRNKNGIKGKYREIFDVAVRCFIPSGQEDKYMYTMIITSKREIKNAMIELITGSALGTLNIPIAFTDKGKVDDNKICEIPLQKGRNILHFRFNDNISHKVTTATYEYK